LEHASAVSRKEHSGVSLKHTGEIHTFNTADIDEIVEARLEELFEAIQKEFKRAGRAGKLPSGVVLTGGTALLKDITEYAKEYLGLAARIGKTSGYGGVADDIEKPQYATVVGLMLIDAEFESTQQSGKKKSSGSFPTTFGTISKLFARFKA
jgi:cell division protein FtsA